MKVCTIVARNYLPQARVLAQSFGRYHPGNRLVVLVLDDESRAVRPEAEPFDVLRPSDLKIDQADLRHMLVMYDVLEISTAVKPWLLQFLLDEGASSALYLDPDIEVFDSLDELGDLARTHGIVLTPHRVEPMPRDGHLPGETDLMISGAYNLGFIALSPSAKPFLDWWCERLRRDCIHSVDQGLFVDQRWVDLVPSLFGHYILRDPTYNVAYWNVDARPVEWSGPRPTINGRPLRFFHFSGFDPDKPSVFSKHMRDRPRIKLEGHPVIGRLCRAYGEQLIANGYREQVAVPYAYERAEDGLKFDRRMRRLYRDDLLRLERAGSDVALPYPYESQGAVAFRDWLNAPPENTDAPRVSRYLQAFWVEHPGLRAQFPRLSGADGDRFLDWVRRHGSAQAIPSELLPGGKRDREAAAGSKSDVTDARTALQEASSRIERRPDASAPSRFGPLARLGRRLIMRAMRPYERHERDVARGLLEVGHQLDRVTADLPDRLAGAEYRMDKVVEKLAQIEAERKAIPYMSDPGALRTTDIFGRPTIGYRGSVGGVRDEGYMRFEEVFRGREGFIRDRQRPYLDLLTGHEPVIDIGCGRGEMLDLLAGAGMSAIGVDLDDAMVERCRSKGHRAEHLDAVEYLEKQEDGSVGAIFSAQVIEHVSFDELERLLASARRKLRRGGLFIAETVNPHSVPALKTFWVDPTHRTPIFPETLAVLCQNAGFPDAWVFFPQGVGDVTKDLFSTGEYAIVATNGVFES